MAHACLKMPIPCLSLPVFRYVTLDEMMPCHTNRGMCILFCKEHCTERPDEVFRGKTALQCQLRQLQAGSLLHPPRACTEVLFGCFKRKLRHDVKVRPHRLHLCLLRLLARCAVGADALNISECSERP